VHCRIGEVPSAISAIRVAVGEADALIGGDLVVSAGAKTLGLLMRGRSRAVLNIHEIITGDFTRDRTFSLPTDQLALALRGKLGDGAVFALDATKLAETCLGDGIFSNVLMLGAAWQAGLVPLGSAAIRQAIVLNGSGVAGNLKAFEIGRWAIAHPDAALQQLRPNVPSGPRTLDQVVSDRASRLESYQDAALAERYRARVDAANEVDPDFACALAEGYFKLLAYKDEYEVARLHVAHLETALEARFERIGDIRFHLAPPILSRIGLDGRPKKREYGSGMLRLMRILAALKGLRGTRFDPFGRTAERKMERALISEYETDMNDLQAALTHSNRDIAVELAALPLEIRGFGPVKEAAIAQVAKRRETLLAAFDRADETAIQAAG
jgi:indolepyruvate ferredoxin oxidoreductase